MTEAEIRAALIARLSDSPEGAGAAFISELCLDRFARRADLVMANGLLSVFEIKSPRDSLARLDGQLGTYTKHFEQVTIVCAEKHIGGVRACAPPGVGIWRVSHDGEITVVRMAKKKPVTSREIWLSFVPVDEVRSLLRESQLAATGTRSELVERCAELKLAAVRQFVLQYLKRRHLRLLQDKTRRQQARVAFGPELTAEMRLEQFLAGRDRPQHRTATPRRVRSHTLSSKSRSSSASRM